MGGLGAPGPVLILRISLSKLCPRSAGGNDSHVHMAEMGGACSDLVLSDQLLGVVRNKVPRATSFLKVEALQSRCGCCRLSPRTGHGGQRYCPIRSAFLEREPRELSCFCLSWTEGGDTTEGQGLSKALLWPT